MSISRCVAGRVQWACGHSITALSCLLGGGMPPLKLRPAPVGRLARAPIGCGAGGRVACKARQRERPPNFSAKWRLAPKWGGASASASSRWRRSTSVAPPAVRSQSRLKRGGAQKMDSSRHAIFAASLPMQGEGGPSCLRFSPKPSIVSSLRC